MTTIVFSNKETSSLVRRRWLYHARAACLPSSEGEERGGEEDIYRRRRGAKPSRAVLLSSALTSFTHGNNLQ